MKQQINLYQSISSDQKKPLSARTIALLLLLAAAVLGGLGALGEWQAGRLQQQLDEVEHQQAVLQRQLAALKGTPADETSRLAVEVQRLRSERDQCQALLGFLQEGPEAATAGFSSYLAGLARQTVPGVWLRRIALHQGGGAILLEGSTERAEAVPRLVRQLAAEPAFAGVEFAQLLLARSEAPSVIDFRLDTSGRKEAP